MGSKARDRMKEMADIRADFRKRQDELIAISAVNSYLKTFMNSKQKR
jgi:hypothetical protein